MKKMQEHAALRMEPDDLVRGVGQPYPIDREIECQHQEKKAPEYAVRKPVPEHKQEKRRNGKPEQGMIVKCALQVSRQEGSPGPGHSAAGAGKAEGGTQRADRDPEHLGGSVKQKDRGNGRRCRAL